MVPPLRQPRQLQPPLSLEQTAGQLSGLRLSNMTRLEALSQVRSTIAEPTEGYWTDAELERYINEGLHAMCESKGIEDVQRLVLDADLRCGLPALAKFVESVYFYPIEGAFTFVSTAPATPAEGDQYIDSTTMRLYSRTATAWVEQDLPTRENLQETKRLKEIKDNYMVFSEKLSGLLEVFMYRFPTPLAAPTDAMELPESYCVGVVAYATAQAVLKDDNFPQFDRRMMEFVRIRLAWEKERSYKVSHFISLWGGN